MFDKYIISLIIRIILFQLNINCVHNYIKMYVNVYYDKIIETFR